MPMRIPSDEFYKVRYHFEKVCRYRPTDCTEQEDWSEGKFYQDPITNELFQMFIAGYTLNSNPDNAHKPKTAKAIAFREKRCAYQKARRKRLKDQGLCTHCGKEKADAGYATCAECRAQNTLSVKMRTPLAHFLNR